MTIGFTLRDAAGKSVIPLTAPAIRRVAEATILSNTVETDYVNMPGWNWRKYNAVNGRATISLPAMPGISQYFMATAKLPPPGTKFTTGINCSAVSSSNAIYVWPGHTSQAHTWEIDIYLGCSLPPDFILDSSAYGLRLSAIWGPYPTDYTIVTLFDSRSRPLTVSNIIEIPYTSFPSSWQGWESVRTRAATQTKINLALTQYLDITVKDAYNHHFRIIPHPVRMMQYLYKNLWMTYEVINQTTIRARLHDFGYPSSYSHAVLGNIQTGSKTPLRIYEFT